MPWIADILPGFERLEIELPAAESEPGESGEPPVATLVRASAANRPRAVLYLNGWNDYFFQTHVAEAWIAMGYDFYALDLRRYGRSLRPGQFPGFVADLSDHFAEIDLALERLSADHGEVVLTGHSTGGLTASLWASERPGRLAGLVLNSPWIASQGPFPADAFSSRLARAAGRIKSTRVLPIKDAGTYARSLHVNWHGEWDYNLDWKRNPGGPVRPAWLGAVLAGHDRVAAGLGINVPILMLASARSGHFEEWSDEATTVDSVLDVDQLAAAAPRLGGRLTLIRLEGALHDVFLSTASVRTAAFAELARWEAAYLR